MNGVTAWNAFKTEVSNFFSPKTPWTMEKGLAISSSLLYGISKVGLGVLCGPLPLFIGGCGTIMVGAFIASKHSNYQKSQKPLSNTQVQSNSISMTKMFKSPFMNDVHGTLQSNISENQTNENRCPAVTIESDQETTAKFSFSYQGVQYSISVDSQETWDSLVGFIQKEKSNSGQKALHPLDAFLDAFQPQLTQETAPINDKRDNNHTLMKQCLNNAKLYISKQLESSPPPPSVTTGEAIFKEKNTTLINCEAGIVLISAVALATLGASSSYGWLFSGSGSLPSSLLGRVLWIGGELLAAGTIRYNNPLAKMLVNKFGL